MPKLYSNKLSDEQNTACERLEKLTGLYPAVGLRELDAGLITPEAYWKANVQFVINIGNDANKIEFPQSTKGNEI
jgi:hypothetical protein